MRFFTAFRMTLPKGFTLIELLVVISIIGILTVALLTTFNPFTQLQRGKDAQRKSDFEQLQRAVESFYNDKGRYPCFGNSCTVNGWAIANNLYDGSTIELGPDYIKTIPKDPRYTAPTCTNDRPGYLYAHNATGQSYTLFAKLENDKDAAATTTKTTPSVSAPGGSVDGNKTFTISSGTCSGVTYNYWVNNP